MSTDIETSLNDLQSTLDLYLETLSIKTNNRGEFEKIHRLQLDTIKMLTSEECAEYATLASIFSLHIQTEINRQSSMNKWAKHNLNIVLGKYAKDFGTKWDKFEERSLMVQVENEYAQKLNRIIKETMVRIETLNFISRKIETINNSLIELSRSKRRTE